MEKKGYITKGKLLEIVENYDIRLTDKMISDYKKIGLIEPSIMENKARVGIEGKGNVGFYKVDTWKIIYTIQGMLNLGIGITLEKIKHYLTLLKLFTQRTSQGDEIYKGFNELQKKIDILNFKELETLKEDDTFIKRILSDPEIDEKTKLKCIDAIPIFRYPSVSMRAITEWDIFGELIVFRSDTELDYELYRKYRKWESVQEIDVKDMYELKNNPDGDSQPEVHWHEMVTPILETNIEDIDEKNLDQLFIVVKYGKPVNKVVYFRKGKIEVTNC